MALLLVGFGIGLLVYRSFRYARTHISYYDNGTVKLIYEHDIDNKVKKLHTYNDIYGRSVILNKCEIPTNENQIDIIPLTVETKKSSNMIESAESINFTGSTGPVGLLTSSYCVWKLCAIDSGKRVYVKILLFEDTKRVTTIHSYKSRIDYGKVVDIVDNDNNHYSVAYSCIHTYNFVYKLGEIVRADNFDDNVNNSCSGGISVHKYKDHCDQWR